MKSALSLLALVLLACTLPRTATAQCDDGCARLVRNGVPTGWGCDYVEGSGMSCIATRTSCSLQRCMNAYLTTPGGRFVEMRSECARPEAAPARVASALRAVSERAAASLALRQRILARSRRAAGAGRA